MKLIHLLLFLSFSLLLPGCLSTGSSSPPAGIKPPVIEAKGAILLTSATATWDNIEDVRRAVKGKAVTVTSNSLDLKGWSLDGRKLKHYKDVQDERNEPLRINIPDFTLKNGYVTDVPGGIIGKAESQTYSGLTFTKIGEDALSSVVDKAPNTTVKNCKFYGATDKSSQNNDARNLTFTGNYITGGITGVRVQESKTKFKNIKVKSFTGNTFEDLQTAVNVSGGAKVTGFNNKYIKVGKKSVTSNGASFSEK